MIQATSIIKMVDEKSNQSFNIGKIWKLKPVWETDHIGMRACVPPVRGFLVAGWHARTSRETGWILNSGVSVKLCVALLRAPILTQRFKYLRIWFETASLHSTLPQSRYSYVCICVRVYMRFMIGFWFPLWTFRF